MLKISHLSKSYKSTRKAVDDLSLTLEPGDLFGFIGHNGAGKTTTLKCVAGILPFEAGEIIIDGKSVKAQPIECKRVTAYIPDSPDLYEYLTGIQYLSFIADVFGLSKADRQEAILRYAGLFELTGNLGDIISSYSHGMKQKLALISALIHRPKLLVLDEPFVGLDPKAAFALKEEMKALCARGCGIFFSTHVLEVAEKLCTKVAIIQRGRLAACGETAAIIGDNSLEHLFMELIQNGKSSVALPIRETQ
jgi:ABC-2 type transport system ATP-binding protein